MNAAALLYDLSLQGVRLSCEDGQLRVRGPEAVLTPAVKAHLKAHKAALLALLEGAADRSATNESRPAAALPQIVPAPEHRYEPFPLAEIQEAYWIGRSAGLELGAVGSFVYFELENRDLDLARLEAAWNRLLDRHDLLRMEVLPTGAQRVLASVPAYEIACEDLRAAAPAARDARLGALRHEQSHQVLDPCRWPLFALRAARLGARHYRLFVGLDLLIVDFMGIFRLLGEWARLYDDPALVLPPLALTFRDYVLSEVALRETAVYKRSLKYWLDRLDALPPAPRLPLAKAPSDLRAYRFTRRASVLDAARWGALVARARAEGLTPSGLLLAAFAEVLTLWCEAPRFTLNLTQYHRLPLHPQMHEFLGNSTAILLVAVENERPEPFLARARRLQKQLLQDLDNLYVNGVTVLRELARRRGAQGARMPVVFTSILGAGLDPRGATARLGEIVDGLTQSPQVWLDHQVLEVDGELWFHWDAVEALFPPGLLDDMFAAYERFLTDLADDATAWTAAGRSLLPPAQRDAIRAANATGAPVSGELLHALAARHMRERPDRPAVLSDRRALSYGELLRRATQVGRRLRELGARPGALVAVVMEKGWEQVVAAYGVLFAGAAYVPVEPDLPEPRVHQMLAHGEVAVALATPALRDRLAGVPGLRVLCVADGDGDDFAAVDAAPLAWAQTPDDLAYVIYTSGSTGAPKGVMISHAAAVNTVLDINARFAVGAGDRVLGLSALGFDLSVYDVFGVLAAGGAVVLPEDTRRKDPAHWVDCMRTHGVTFWNSVPLMLQMLVEHLQPAPGDAPDGLRKVFLSGDWVPPALPARVRALWPALDVLASGGGATETAIWNIVHPIGEVAPDAPRIPYGRPIRNATWYVMNDALEQRPFWTPGELCTGGRSLALGYWRDGEKTAARFVTDPATGERLYRTGDLGRRLPDGTLEILGRLDFQVKVNGYRVELQEVEAALAQHPGVRAAAVLHEPDARGHRRLLAYVVGAGAPPDAERLAAFLRARLPEYMVPAVYVALDALPLNANGKPDRAALPRPTDPPPEDDVTPRSEAEARILGIVREVLSGPGGEAPLDQGAVGMAQNLFDLGANSLHVVQLHARLKAAFARDVPIVEIFQHPTIRALARSFAGGGGDALDADRARAQAQRQRDYLARQRARRGGAR